MPEQNIKYRKSMPVSQPQKVQLNKKPPCIKLEVNKLVKPESQQVSTTKNNLSYNSSHNVSSEIYDHNNSIEKELDKEIKNTKGMNFEQLYFQKIKELRQQTNNENYNKQKPVSHNFLVETKQEVPLSCKNSHMVKNSNKFFTKKDVQSTKNYYSEGNKENSEVQNYIESKTSQKFKNKFFKKSSPLENNDNIFNYSKAEEKKKDEQKTETEKVRKILKLKKANGRTKSQFYANSSIEKEPNCIIERNLLCSMENPTLSPLDVRPNLSEELSKLRLSTPSHSSVSKTLEYSTTEGLIREIIERKVDHLSHEHVWGGVECFFSFEEFRMILKELGFNAEESASIEFYVKRLWEHLGGDLYGGIVKKNMIELLNIVFEDEEKDEKENTEQKTDESYKLPLPNDFIESSSLKLIKFNNQLRDQIKTFYFSLRMTKIASQIKDSDFDEYIPKNPKNSPNFSEKIQSQRVQNSLQCEDTPKEKFSEDKNLISLENNPYLESISVKNRQPEMSPCLIPKLEESMNQMNVTDFSPKMSNHQYEPFQSTILQKEEFNEKLQTEIEPEDEMTYKSNRKALLSVDVNLGEGTLEKIVVYEGQDPYEVSLQLKNRYNIDEKLREKFEALLKNHLKNLLFKIEEVSEELFEDSLELKDHDNSTDFIIMEKESIL